MHSSKRKIKLASIGCLIVLALALIGLQLRKPITTLNLDEPCELSDYVGVEIIVVGEAMNAKEGAIIGGEHGMVIINSLNEWPGIRCGEEVSMRGTLEKKVWPNNEDDNFISASPTGTFYYLSPRSLGTDKLPR